MNKLEAYMHNIKSSVNDNEELAGKIDPDDKLSAHWRNPLNGLKGTKTWRRMNLMIR